jgi:uncharacterized protein
MYVVNRTRGTYLGVDVKCANTFRARLLGLYGHRELPLGDGVWLVPCVGVQTIGMKRPIDVVFFNSASRVVRTYENLRAGRVILWVPGAVSALEVPAGVVASSETKVGDVAEFVDSLSREDAGVEAVRS